VAPPPEATDDLCRADLRDGVVEIPCGGIDGVGGEEVDVVVMADNARYTGLLLEAGFAPEQERLRNRIR
jgi:hypothetical protein